VIGGTQKGLLAPGGSGSKAPACGGRQGPEVSKRGRNKKYDSVERGKRRGQRKTSLGVAVIGKTRPVGDGGRTVTYSESLNRQTPGCAFMGGPGVKKGKNEKRWPCPECSIGWGWFRPGRIKTSFTRQGNGVSGGHQGP